MTTTRNSGRIGRSGALIRPGLAGVQPPRVELDVRTAFDFTESVSCGEPEDLLPQDRDWLEEKRAALLGQLEGYDAKACFNFAMEIGRVAILRPEVQSAADLVATIDRLNDADLLAILLGELAESDDFGAATRTALTGDKAAFETLKKQLEEHKGEPVFVGELPDLATAARKLVHSWLPSYQQVEDRVGRMIARDASARDIAEAAADPLGFVERVTNGIRLVPEARLRRVVLIPSYFGRPYNSLTKIGDTQVILYPIADSALGAASRTTPPAATLRLYRALGDESRLRILRLLADRDRYLTELANELDLSKPTVSHHLAQLRSAGLVLIIEQGNLTYYTLRRDRVREAGPELADFLAH